MHRKLIILLVFPLICFSQGWNNWSGFGGGILPAIECDTASVFNVEYVSGEDSVLITIQHFDINMTVFSCYANIGDYPDRGNGVIVFKQFSDTTGFTSGKKIYFNGTGETFYFALYHYGFKYWTPIGNNASPVISPDDFTPPTQPTVIYFDTLTIDSIKLNLENFSQEPKAKYWLTLGDTLSQLDTSGANIGDSVYYTTDTTSLLNFTLAHNLVRTTKYYFKLYGCDSLDNYFTPIIDSLTIPEFYVTLVSAGGTDSLNIKWFSNDPTDSVIYYSLYRSINDGSFSLLDTILAPDTTFTDDSGISSPNKYSYYLTATNDNGTSDPSDTVSASIPEIVDNQIYYKYPTSTTTDLTLAAIIEDAEDADNTLFVTDLSNINCSITETSTLLRITPSPGSYTGTASFILKVTDPNGFWIADSINIKFY